MKKLFLTSAILLLSSMWALAQSSAQPTTQDQYGGAQSQQPDKSKQGTSEKGEQTIEGCLSGAANEYVLTDSTGRTYELLDDTHQLDANVGHQVRLTGSVSLSAGGERSSTRGPQKIFGVKKVQSLSDKCK
jgi:hypothetical protein